MLKYKKIFVDFDETIAESILAVTEIVNKKYGKDAQPWQVKSWDFLDVYPFLKSEELIKIFESEEFFKILKCKPNAQKVLSNLSQYYEIELVTVASDKAIKLKKDFIKINFPFIKKIHQIRHGESKSIVDMSGGIFFDDVDDNLHNSNAMTKVIIINNFNADWNSNWKGHKIINWIEAYQFF